MESTVPVHHPDRLLSKAEVLERVPLSYSHIWTLMQRGEFPRSVRVGDNPKRDRAFWYESEINEWLRTLPRTEIRANADD